MIVGSGGAGPPGFPHRQDDVGATPASASSQVGRPRAEEAVMSEEAVPQQAGPAQPKGLLQQMEELMASLNADLSALDADLQSAGTTGSAQPADLNAGQAKRP
jgi:hypothetical protein